MDFKNSKKFGFVDICDKVMLINLIITLRLHYIADYVSLSMVFNILNGIV